MQTLIARNVPSHNAVISITQVHSGSTWNVIPDSAWLEGTVRTFNQDTRELIERRFGRFAGIAAAFDTDISLDWQPGPPSVVNTARGGFRAGAGRRLPASKPVALSQPGLAKTRVLS